MAIVAMLRVHGLEEAVAGILSALSGMKEAALGLSLRILCFWEQR
jgi:hypothetical protein